MVSVVLDFESKNLFAENKRPCLSRLVDFSKLSQVVVGSSFLFMIFEWDKKCFDTGIFPRHHVQVLRQVLFLKISYDLKLIICWIKLLKT